MERQTIEFVVMKETRTPFDLDDAFQYRKDRPLPWLQKACFFVLRKLRAFSVSEAVDVERRTIDAGTFMSRLFEQRESVTQLLGRRPTMLLIGAEDYAELMREAEAIQMFSFRAEYGYDREILDMTVRVIPWMRGCLVLPDGAGHTP